MVIYALMRVQFQQSYEKFKLSSQVNNNWVLKNEINDL